MYIPDNIVNTPNIFFNTAMFKFRVYLLDSNEKMVKIKPMYKAAKISTCFAL